MPTASRFRDMLDRSRAAPMSRGEQNPAAIQAEPVPIMTESQHPAGTAGPTPVLTGIPLAAGGIALFSVNDMAIKHLSGAALHQIILFRAMIGMIDPACADRLFQSRLFADPAPRYAAHLIRVLVILASNDERGTTSTTAFTFSFYVLLGFILILLSMFLQATGVLTPAIRSGASSAPSIRPPLADIPGFC